MTFEKLRLAASPGCCLLVLAILKEGREQIQPANQQRRNDLNDNGDGVIAIQHGLIGLQK